MTFEQLVQQFGLPITMLLVALVSGARGVWVFGREFRASVAREEEWKQIAYKALNVGEKVVSK